MNILQRILAAFGRQVERENKVTSVDTAAPNLQQTCKSCGRPDKFDFTVPDEIWNLVIPEALRNRVVCLYCFDELASGNGIQYRIEELFFAGRSVAFRFIATEPNWKAIAEELYWALTNPAYIKVHDEACWVREPEFSLKCVCGIDAEEQRWSAALAHYEAAKQVKP